MMSPHNLLSLLCLSLSLGATRLISGVTGAKIVLRVLVVVSRWVQVHIYIPYRKSISTGRGPKSERIAIFIM
jgi:hypothetical protein